MRKLLLMFVVVSLLSDVAMATKIYKCKVDNKTIFQDAPCAEDFDYGLEDIDTFDSWMYGMNIIAFKEQAKLRNLPVSPGLNAYIRKYNDKIINSKADARIYSYNSKVAGKRAKVTLLFTEKTQRLYKVKARLYMTQLPAEEKKYFYEGLVKQLSKKYGGYLEAKNYPRNANLMAKYVLKDMVGTEKIWGSGGDNVVSLTGDTPSAPAYDLVYKYIPLMKLSISETTKIIQSTTDKNLIRDSSKF